MYILIQLVVILSLVFPIATLGNCFKWTGIDIAMDVSLHWVYLLVIRFSFKPNLSFNIWPVLAVKLLHWNFHY